MQNCETFGSYSLLEHWLNDLTERNSRNRYFLGGPEVFKFTAQKRIKKVLGMDGPIEETIAKELEKVLKENSVIKFGEIFWEPLLSHGVYTFRSFTDGENVYGYVFPDDTESLSSSRVNNIKDMFSKLMHCRSFNCYKITFFLVAEYKTWIKRQLWAGLLPNFLDDEVTTTLLHKQVILIRNRGTLMHIFMRGLTSNITKNWTLFYTQLFKALALLHESDYRKYTN